MHCFPEVRDTYKQCEDKATQFDLPYYWIKKKNKPQKPVKPLNMVFLLTYLSKTWMRLLGLVGQESLLPRLLPLRSELILLQGWWERSQDLPFKDLIWKALEAGSLLLYPSAVWNFPAWCHLVLELSRVHQYCKTNRYSNSALFWCFTGGKEQPLRKVENTSCDSRSQCRWSHTPLSGGS